jgi:magnesium transporter
MEELGKAPGTLIFVGQKKLERPIAEVIEFTAEKIKVYKDHGLNDLEQFKTSDQICWINISGIHNAEAIKQIGDQFGLHILLLEDILNTTQRPKFEEYDDHLFLVLKMLRLDPTTNKLISEQLSLIVGEKYLISFQEDDEDVFKDVRNRLLRPTTKIRHRKSDYLAYALMDAVVDHYKLIIEQFGEKIEELDQALIDDAKPEHLEKIYAYKREINYLRKTVRPVRDLVLGYKTAELAILEDQTLSFIKDLEDHVLHTSDSVETFQVMLNDQLNLYQSIVNNRLNDILRVLTIFSVVFIPLTFIAGVYGTNFKYLPELDYPYAYPIFWLVMIIVGSGMLIYFKRKNWL